MSESYASSLINGAKYLFLRHVGEPRENSLLLIVEEGMPIEDDQAQQSLAARFPVVAGILKDARVVRSTHSCKKFELRWERYVAYSITNESVGSGARYDDEVYTGQLLREYTKSHFLDHLSRDTGGHLNAPILHYKLICQNHMIDVASYTRPEIRVIDVSSSPHLQ
jgi:hypothetical protein